MSQASDRLARYIAAETAVLEGQEVRREGESGGQRMWRGADLAEIRAEIAKLKAEVAAEEAAATNRPSIGGLGFALARLDGC